jgi:hypothetical protein
MEKRSAATRQLALGGVVVGILVAVTLFMKGREDGPVRESSREASSGEANPSSVASTAPSIEPPQAAPEPSPAMPEEVFAQILKKDKKLATFMDFKKTVLLDTARRDEYRRLLSSVDMMNAMAEELMKPGSGHVEPEEYYRRLMQIDYFEAALDWKDNPQRDKVLAVTGEIIGKDNFVAGLDSARRQTLGGNKMELYRLMYAQDPQKAEALVQQAKGTRMEPMVSWMVAEEVRRHTREQEIQKEVEELQAKN